MNILSTKAGCLLLLFGGFTLACLLSFFVLKYATKDYKEMKHSEGYRGTIISIKTYRGFGYLTVTNGEKYLIHNTRNYNYKPYTLGAFLMSGDSIEKRKDSDDLIIFRNGAQYYFVLGKDIGNER